jgi:hypothetical protein
LFAVDDDDDDDDDSESDEVNDGRMKRGWADEVAYTGHPRIGWSLTNKKKEKKKEKKAWTQNKQAREQSQYILAK